MPRRRCRVAFATILAGLALSTAAIGPVSAANDAFARLFESRGNKVCFQRAYDDAHLAAHPRQLTRVIVVEMAARTGDGQRQWRDRFELGVGIMARGSKQWATATSYCKTKGQVVECHVEGDGGRFTLSPRADGGVELRTTGLDLDSDDFLSIGGGRSDDNVFVLAAAQTNQCAEAAAAR